MPERHLKAVERAGTDEEPRGPLLRLVNPDDGTYVEVVGNPIEQLDRLKRELAENEDERDGLVETVRSQAAKIRNLRRDRERSAGASANWPAALEAFEYWRVVTGHPRSKFTVERFYLLEPFLERDGLDLVKLAIDGAGHEPYRADKPNRNGTVEVYDSLETIFKSRASFERHVNRAPRERLRQVRDEAGVGFGPPYTPLELRIKAEVILKLNDETDDRDMGIRVSEAVDYARRELEGRGQAPDSTAPAPPVSDPLPVAEQPPLVLDYSADDQAEA